MTWYRNLWQRLADKFLDHWLNLIVIGITAGVIFSAKDWLLKSIPVWPIVLIVIALVITFLSVRLFKLRRKSFRPFRVFDTDLDTIWWVQKELDRWIDDAFDRKYPNTYTNHLLDGPYCGRKRANGDHCLGDFIDKRRSRLSERCRMCNRPLFEDAEGDLHRVDVSADDLKLLAIQGLQREHRRGRRVRKNFNFGVAEFADR